MRITAALLLSAIIGSLVACAHVGEPMDPQALTQVVEGKTTKAELVAQFGQPMVVTRDSDGIELLSWSHVSIGAFGGSYRQQTFTAWIDPQGVVSRYTVSTVNP